LSLIFHLNNYHLIIFFTVFTRPLFHAIERTSQVKELKS
jgi:hypothetical protein